MLLQQFIETNKKKLIPSAKVVRHESRTDKDGDQLLDIITREPILKMALKTGWKVVDTSQPVPVKKAVVEPPSEELPAQEEATESSEEEQAPAKRRRKS